MDLVKIMSSQINFKIISFFNENPAALDTPRGVATWIGEERDKTKRALNNLVAAKILIAHKATSTTGYSYTRDAVLISKISKLLKAKSL